MLYRGILAGFYNIARMVLDRNRGQKSETFRGNDRCRYVASAASWYVQARYLSPRSLVCGCSSPRESSSFFPQRKTRRRYREERKLVESQVRHGESKIPKQFAEISQVQDIHETFGSRPGWCGLGFGIVGQRLRRLLRAEGGHAATRGLRHGGANDT